MVPPIETAAIPNFFYGTAWKEENTAALTLQALSCGFTAIDTANQRKHYFEEAVGNGIQKYLANSSKTRSDLFIQTKYTFARGQDHRKPYDESDSFTIQVQQSFESSILHLKTNYLDSLVLHGPYTNDSITDPDIEVWRAMENLKQRKKVIHLGISNISLDQLKGLVSAAHIKPTFVQNRCYASRQWDRDIRIFCRENKIRYQGFSLLTANSQEMATEQVTSLVKKYSKSPAQIIFRFAVQAGMIPLTGSSSRDHLLQDLDIFDFELSAAEVESIESVSQ